jgi:hypothetical protein
VAGAAKKAFSSQAPGPLQSIVLIAVVGVVFVWDF